MAPDLDENRFAAAIAEPISATLVVIPAAPSHSTPANDLFCSSRSRTLCQSCRGAISRSLVVASRASGGPTDRRKHGLRCRCCCSVFPIFPWWEILVGNTGNGITAPSSPSPHRDPILSRSHGVHSSGQGSRVEGPLGPDRQAPAWLGLLDRPLRSLRSQLLPMHSAIRDMHRKHQIRSLGLLAPPIWAKMPPWAT